MISSLSQRTHTSAQYSWWSWPSFRKLAWPVHHNRSAYGHIASCLGHRESLYPCCTGWLCGADAYHISCSSPVRLWDGYHLGWRVEKATYNINCSRRICANIGWHKLSQFFPIKGPCAKNKHMDNHFPGLNSFEWEFAKVYEITHYTNLSTRCWSLMYACDMLATRIPGSVHVQWDMALFFKLQLDGQVDVT